MTKHLTILIAILLAALGLKAQTKVYPIQVTISGSGDISAELSELYGVKSTLMFTFQCLDRSETSLPVAVKVRLYPSTGHGKAIENKLQTGKKTFDIGFGQTIIEQKGELEKYFLNEYTNLSQAGYYQNGQLAEGNYILQVTCYDARTITRQISNTAKMYLHIDQFNYPTLLFPRSGTDLEQYTTKPAISFQWTYYGKTDPKIRYRFELWEVINATTVETYVKQNKPIFSEENLFVTQKSYMPELLQLKIGQKYCWRVTAYDDDHKLPFKRGGESDVYQFQYLNPPVPVTGLANKVTGKQIKYTWNADRNHTKYYVEYYDYKRDTTISSSQQDNTVTLTAPEYDYRIKFRVRAENYNDPSRVSEYTPWSEAYVQPEKKIDFECGKQFPDREIANQELKTTFFEGEIVESKNGDSRYEIIKATANPDGSLDGKFYAIMDCWSGAKILCDFWDTKINTDNVIITTRYRSEDIPGFVADPEEIKQYVHELVNNVHMAATDNKIRDTILINQKFDYLYTENGRLKAVVVDKNGEPQVTDVTPDKPYSQSLITDGQGDTLVVSKKGQVMGVNEYKFAGDDRHLLNEYHRQLDSLGDWQINFKSAKEKQTYAFDQIGSGNHGIFATDEYYPKSGNYDFRYKSVECGQNDKVIVDFGSYPEKDSVIFKDKYGVKLKVVDGNILAFTGVSKADTNFIYAYRGDQKIGKLFLNTYQKKTYKVVLISVNGAKLPNVKDLENELNKVYRQCADSFKIETRNLSVSGIENFTHGGTKVAGSVWNASQKTVLEAFGEKYEDNTAYLFFIPKAETNGVAGYMPRYYPYGFIYPGAANRTIAHELGHGIAGLEHPFPESQVSGNTANLMDYRDGTELWHFQWDMLQDPSRKIFKWWQNEQDAEAYGTNTHWICLKTDIITQIKKISDYYYLPNGKIANFKHRTPSAFYAADDGSAPTSYGAVAAIREFDYDFILHYYKTLNNGNEPPVYHNLGFGHKMKDDNNEDYNDICFPIEELDYSAELNPIKVKIEGQKAVVYCNDIKVAEFDDAICSYRSANYINTHCLSLYSKYKAKNSPLFNSHVLKTAIEKNPCILEGMDYFKVVKTESEFMDGLYRMVNAGLTVAAIPIVMPILAEEFAANAPQKAIDFTVAFSTDFMCSYVVNIISYYLTKDEDKETNYGGLPAVISKVWDESGSEMLIDAAMAGGKAMVPAMSNTKRKIINAGIDGVQALEFVRICKTISGTASAEERTNFEEQVFNFAVGVGLSYLSDYLSTRISKSKFNKTHYIAVFRQALKNMKMTDDDIATLIYQTAKKCNHPVFKNLNEADERIIRKLLSDDNGAKLLDIACNNNIYNVQTIKLLSYCQNKFDVGLRNIDLRINPKVVGYLDYIAENLDEEGCLLVNSILNISNPEKVLPDLAETLRLFEKEGIKKEWIRQYYNYIKQETIVIHYKGHAYKFDMPKTIGELKNNFTDIKVSSKIEFIEFHAIDNNGNPSWCFVYPKNETVFIPQIDEITNRLIYTGIDITSSVASNYFRSDHFKILVGIITK